MRFGHLVGLVVFSLKLVLPSPVFAIPSFSTDYDASYIVKQEGPTHVVFNISQKNNLSTVYATSFSLSVSQTNLENVKVSDSSGEIEPLVTKTANITNITFEFGSKVVGKDKINRFRIEYDTTDIAVKTGQIWEVNIPKLEADENISSEQITLSVPDTFPAPAFIDPKPVRDDGHTFFFNSFSMGNRAITALFGSHAYYQLDLSYFLSNESLQSETKTITIPPQTNYQQVFIQSLDPKPSNIVIDPDGNFLALYELKPKSSLSINNKMVIRTNIKPEVSKTSPSRELLASNKHWNFNEPIFAKTELNLTKPLHIYDFVTSKLSYNFGKITGSVTTPQRPGGAYALANPDLAICTEYSDLFISLARKNGFPAREHQGFAISNNDQLKPLSLSKDVLHSWPAYFDQSNSTWIEVDPTWGYTTGGVDYFQKLDLNHLTFVIHGHNSDLPLPAGAFRNPSSSTKDVQVMPTDPIEFPATQFKLTLLNQDGGNLQIELENLSGVAGIANLKTSSGSSVQINEQNLFMAPFSKQTVTTAATHTPLFLPTKSQLIIELNGQQLTREITLEPSFTSRSFLILGVSFGALAIFSWGLYFLRRRR